ncbi:MAG: fimbrillin family protein [Muribaculaceae bacterium]|nr:fimbrillin family protein [Muribaculaceae bacterium]
MHISKATCGISFLIAANMFLSSCKDELLNDGLVSNDEIAFRASVQDRPSGHASRSGVAGGCEYLGAEAVTSDLDQTLYVHTIINEDQIGHADSRAAVITKEELKSFNVSAYAYNGSWTTPSGTTRPNLIRNAVVTEQNNSVWEAADKHYWPVSEERVRFYAYANLPGTTMPYTNFTQLSYTVNSDVTRQNDIIAAVSDVETAKYKGSAVTMDFHHILTGIRFRPAEGDNELIYNYTIKSVTFDGIYGAGTFTLKEFTDDPIVNRDAMWSLSQGTSTPAPRSFTVTFGTSGTTPVKGEYINSESQTLMMIPQKLSGTSQVTVTLLDKNGREYQLVKTLSGEEWGMGQMITYVISTKSILVEDVFEIYEVSRSTATGPVTEEKLLPSVYTYEAPYYNYNMYDSTEVSMTSHYCIRSYRKEYPKYVNGQLTGDIRITPLAYTSEGNSDWITTAENTHEDNVDTHLGKYYDMVVDAQKLTQYDPWQKFFDNRTAADVMPSYSLDSDGYYDLSKRYSKDDAGTVAEINTSNCYIVSAPGKYKFPVVYGNSIRHNKINYESFGGFKPATTTTNRLSDQSFILNNPFTNADGEPISDEKDVNGGDFVSIRVKNATNPTLIWADFPEIVDDTMISLSNLPNSASSDADEDITLDDVGTIKMKYVYFELTKENIQQGNMMIGFISGTASYVNWSWHIWITPFVPDNHNGMNDKANEELAEEDRMLEVSSFTVNGTKFNLLPYNLGWCNRIYLTFGSEDRSTEYVFTQTATGKVIKFTVFQPHATDVQHGNNLLYQWGRKDPLRGSYSFAYGTPQLKPFY